VLGAIESKKKFFDRKAQKVLTSGMNFLIIKV